MTPTGELADALLVVDLQLDFMPGGALGVAGGDEIVAPIARLARGFATVVATQDWHPAGHVSFASTHGRPAFAQRSADAPSATLWPDHCVQGSVGAALHPGLPDEVIDVVLRKGATRDVDSYSAFREDAAPDGSRASTGLAELLRARGVERVFVCGLARDVCVAATAIDASQAGFHVVVLDALTRAVDPGARASTDARLRAAGVEIEVES